MATARFDSTLGAAFVGFAVAAMLYGILLNQAYSYFQRFTYDRPIYKTLVVLVLLLETVHSVFSGHAVYHYAISSFDDPLALLVPTWTIIAQVLVGACISVVVKVAFSMRVWRFSHNNIILTGTILLLSAAVLGLSALFVVKALQLKTFAEQPKLNWLTTSILSISVFVDLLIAVSLTYFLHHLRNAFSANTLINGLIVYSLETGTITSMCGVATLVSFDMLPTTFVYLSFFFVLSKLYSNSLLATLNTRRVVRGRGTDHAPGTNGEFTIIHTAGQVQTTHSIFGQVDWSKQPQDLEVNVLQEVISTPSEPDHHRTKTIEDSPDSYNSSSRWDAQQHISGSSTDHTNVTDNYGVRAPEHIARF